MKNMHEQITQLRQELTTALAAATTSDTLEQIRVAFLGRNGHIAALMAQLKNLSADDKRTVGPALNELKSYAEQAVEKRKQDVELSGAQHAAEQQKYFDVTAYKQVPRGSLHIYTHITEQLERIFSSMGYDIVDGPEIETDFYNFQALNIPDDHPAREMHDTFWLTTPGKLLRTHTSTVQIRTMQVVEPPLAIFAPGRVYRNEATDATHDFMFTQGEFLMVDKNISISNLLATAKTFLQLFFGRTDLQIRVRPGFFPFVEPGVEIDCECPFCTSGCSVCKRTRWIELLGAGLVHPNVLRACSIDPEVYTGFACGFGIERLAMIKYGINDIRLFHSGNMSFLEQF